MSDAANVEKSPKKHVFKYVLAGVLAVLGILITSVIALVFMVFSAPDKQPVSADPSVMDFYCYGRITKKFYRQLKKRPVEINTLVLKADEVNSVIRCAVFFQKKISKNNDSIKLSDLDLVFENGVFSGTIPLDTGIRFLNGGVVAVKFTAKINKTPGKLEINVLTAKAGKISLPVSKVNQYVNRALESDEIKEDLSKLDSILETISVESDGQLKLTYYPANLMNAVLN